MIKRKKITRLSFKFTIVVICSAAIATSMFGILFMNRYRVFHFVINENALKKSTASSVEELQKALTDKQISKNDEQAIRQEMRQFRELTMQLYDEESTYYVDHLSPLENDVYIQTSSFLLTLYYPNYEFYQLKFYDGTLPLTVYSYQGVVFMEFFLLAAAALSIAVFLLIIMAFVHRKMKYILSIGEEMRYIEGGDYHHTIVYKGNDEITSLAKQLNSMRNALYENIKKEKVAREANQELVTAMSHDLRTPLTSLLGYLDILDMKIYKDDSEREDYVKKCKQKADQIKDMSDRLFNHFLVYAQNEEYELKDITSDILNALLESQCVDLMAKEYDIDLQITSKSYIIKGEKALLKRVLDNIFSNLLKYAKKEEINVGLKVEHDQVHINIFNLKKQDVSEEESTHIGLKSVDKMMSYMNGAVIYENKDESFEIELVFPCIDNK